MQEHERLVKARRDRYEARQPRSMDDPSASSGGTPDGGNSSLKGQQELDIGDIMDWVTSLWARHANHRETSKQLQQRCDQGDVEFERVREWVQTQRRIVRMMIIQSKNFPCRHYYYCESLCPLATR